MYNFNKQLDLIIEDIIQSVTPEELKERQEEYTKIKIKMKFERLLTEGKMTKNPDGSYDVDGDIDLYYMNLRNFKDIPYVLNKVNGFFNCSSNILTSLEGCPKKVNKYFSCSDNKLTSLEGCPKEVYGSFYCNDNKLTSLEGCPEEINGYFNCSWNQLTSLVGCPKTVDWSFSCNDNLKRFTKEDVKKLCVVGGKISV